jgi:hypothetical protein
MKTWKPILFCLSALIPSLGFAQPANLADAWKDPKFVKSFTGSFLALTEQEPKITEREAELFQELADLLAANQNEQAMNRLAQAVNSAGDPSTVSAALNYTLGNLYLQNSRYAMMQSANTRFPFKNSPTSGAPGRTLAWRAFKRACTIPPSKHS